MSFCLYYQVWRTNVDFSWLFFVLKWWQHWTSEEGISQILSCGDIQKAERPSLNLCDQQTFPFLHRIVLKFFFISNTDDYYSLQDPQIFPKCLFVCISEVAQMVSWAPSCFWAFVPDCVFLSFVLRFPTIVVPLFVKEFSVSVWKLCSVSVRKIYSVSVRIYIQFRKMLFNFRVLCDRQFSLLCILIFLFEIEQYVSWYCFTIQNKDM